VTLRNVTARRRRDNNMNAARRIFTSSRLCVTLWWVARVAQNTHKLVPSMKEMTDGMGCQVKCSDSSSILFIFVFLLLLSAIFHSIYVNSATARSCTTHSHSERTATDTYFAGSRQLLGP
jgi:hypothetical protein